MSRIDREKRAVEAMIRLYCNASHQTSREALCKECEELLHYARTRLDRCKFSEQKPSCKKCTVHCYSPAQRERIREVMRFAGPRMILRHPITAIRHLLNR